MTSPSLFSSDLFLSAASTLSDAFKGVVAMVPTPISMFKAQYPTFLKKANEGEAQVIMQGSKRYLLLSEEQVIALAERGKKPRSLGEIVRGVETPSAPLNVQSIHSKPARVAQFKLPDGHVGG